jgi:hypothetical protein
MALNPGNEQGLTGHIMVSSESRLEYMQSNHSTGIKRKRCRICSVIGHNEITCPFISKTQGSFVQQHMSIKERLCGPIIGIVSIPTDTTEEKEN